MAKKDRLARRAEKKAAQEIKMPTQADLDALKQKSLDEGAYTINPNTGKPTTPAEETGNKESLIRTEKFNTKFLGDEISNREKLSKRKYKYSINTKDSSEYPAETDIVQTVTSNNLPGFVPQTIQTQVKPGETTEEALNRTNKAAKSEETTGAQKIRQLKNIYQDTDGINTYSDEIKNTSNYKEVTDLLSSLDGNKFSDEQIDAQIKIDAQKIADAEKKIEGEAAIAKLEAGGDSQIVKSINQAEEELKAANSSVPDETMKTALGVDSPISPTIAKTLEESKTTGNPVEVTTKDIQQYTDAINSEDYYSMSPEEQRQLEAYSKLLNDPKTKVRKSEPALEKLGVQDYYPDMNQGIQEGSYSGSIVGSIPIYTAKGGVLPIGVFDARKRAVEAAAVKAKKEKEDLIELAKVKTAPQYQQAADNLAFAAMDKYLNLAGGDASVLMDPTNPIGMKFQKELNKVNNIKKEAEWMELRGQEILKAINKDEMYVTDETKGVLKQWLGGNYSLDELMKNPKALKEFHNIYNKLKINDNETYTIGQHFTKWKQDIAPINADWNASIEALPADKYNELVAIKARGNNDMFMQAAMKYMPEARLTKLANKLYDTGEFTMSRDDFNTYLGSWFNNEIVTKMDIRDSGRLQERKFQYQKEKDQQDRIFENLKINTNNLDNKKAILKAAQADNSKDKGFFLNTIKRITGQGDATINSHNVVVQKLDSKGLDGKEGTTTFKNSDKFKIGGKWQTAQEVKNKYSNYDKYVTKETDANGKVSVKLNTNLMSLDKVPVPSKEEQAFIKYGYATGWSDNMQFDTKFDKITTYQAYPDPKTGKLIPMTVDDYKDEIKVQNSRPMATVFESTGLNVDGVFNPMATTTKVIDLSNDVDRAILDDYYKGPNTQYSTSGDITRGGTVTDEDVVGGGGGVNAAASSIIDFSGDPVVEEKAE